MLTYLLNKKKRVIEILPGLILCMIITLVGKLIGHYMPKIGAATFAIFIGMAVGTDLTKSPFSTEINKNS